VSEWFEDDAFWRDMAPVMFDESRHAPTAGEVAGVLDLLAPAAGARILDLACGPGRHAAARARAPAAEWMCDDMRAFRRNGALDLAINLYGWYDRRPYAPGAKRLLALATR
jgi:hypothetical protein